MDSKSIGLCPQGLESSRCRMLSQGKGQRRELNRGRRAGRPLRRPAGRARRDEKKGAAFPRQCASHVRMTWRLAARRVPAAGRDAHGIPTAHSQPHTYYRIHNQNGCVTPTRSAFTTSSRCRSRYPKLFLISGWYICSKKLSV